MMFLPAILLEGSVYWDRAMFWLKTPDSVTVPKVDLPLGKVGAFETMKFEVSEQAALQFNAEQIQHGCQSRQIRPGTYTKLIERNPALSKGGVIWMSDTTAERADHQEVYDRCKGLGGRVLIHGLGLGVITNAVLSLPNVEHVEVWELNAEVIELCGKGYQERFGDRLSIVQGDAFQHRPTKGKAWSVVWHDVWPDLSARNLQPMQRLGARFRSRCEWQGFWGRDVCRSMAAQQRSEQRRAYAW